MHEPIGNDSGIVSDGVTARVLQKVMRHIERGTLGSHLNYLEHLEISVVTSDEELLVKRDCFFSSQNGYNHSKSLDP